MQWEGLTETNAVRTLAWCSASEPAVQTEFKDAIAATSTQISEVQKSLEAMPLSDRPKKRRWTKLLSLVKRWLMQRDQARKLKAEGQAEQAVAFVGPVVQPGIGRLSANPA